MVVVLVIVTGFPHALQPARRLPAPVQSMYDLFTITGPSRALVEVLPYLCMFLVVCSCEFHSLYSILVLFILCTHPPHVPIGRASRQSKIYVTITITCHLSHVAM